MQSHASRLSHIKIILCLSVRNHNYLLAGAHPEAINNLCLISKRVLTFSLFHSAPTGSSKYRVFLWRYSGKGVKLAIHLLTVLSYKFTQVHLSWPSGVDLNHKNNFTFRSLRMLLNVPKLLEGKIKIILIVALENLTRIT